MTGMFDVASDFWANKEKLLKDDRYVVYEDDEFLLYQKGKGFLPEYFLWLESKKDGTIKKIRGRELSNKFKEYWKSKVSKGIRDDSVRFKLGEDFIYD